MTWDYLAIRCGFKGLGVTQELSSLDHNGERLGDTWTSERGRVAKTLPELLTLAGEDGWELVTHAVQTSQSSGMPEHYLTFKRPEEDAPVLG